MSFKVWAKGKGFVEGTDEYYAAQSGFNQALLHIKTEVLLVKIKNEENIGIFVRRVGAAIDKMKVQ